MKHLFISTIAIFLMCSCTKKEDTVIVNTTPIVKPVQTDTSTKPKPTAYLDLSPFKLALPINSNGLEQIGTACISIQNAQLMAGYTSKYFYSTADSGVSFWCPIDGATSSPGVGSDHPRTELLENYIWSMNSATASTLTAVMSVNQYPSATNDIIIGQIHGGDTYSAAPFVMLHATAGNIVAYVKGETSGNAGTQHATLLQGVPLNTKISYSIVTDSTNIYIHAACPGATGSGSWSAGIPTAWNGITVRFSAGDYVQAVGSDSTDGGRVTVYNLKITH